MMDDPDGRIDDVIERTSNELISERIQYFLSNPNFYLKFLLCLLTFRFFLLSPVTDPRRKIVEFSGALRKSNIL